MAQFDKDGSLVCFEDGDTVEVEFVRKDGTTNGKKYTFTRVNGYWPGEYSWSSQDDETMREAVNDGRLTFVRNAADYTLERPTTVPVPVDVVRDVAKFLQTAMFTTIDQPEAARLLAQLAPNSSLLDAALRAHREAPADDHAEVAAVIGVVRDHLLGGWRAYADEHCFSNEDGYAIDTRKVHDYIRLVTGVES